MPIDPGRLNTAVEHTPASYDTPLARLERATIHDVAEKMRGQDSDRVHAALVARLAGRFPGAGLDERNLQKLAAAIAAGRVWASAKPKVDQPGERRGACDAPRSCSTSPGHHRGAPIPRPAWKVRRGVR